jgi:hypothetical protein
VAARMRVLIYLFVALCSAASLGAQVPTVDALRRILGRATYAFEGVVQQTHAVTDTGLTASARTAIVHTSVVLACPVDVGDFSNEDVTILSRPRDTLVAGMHAWFFGTGWVIGNHVSIVVSTMLTNVPADMRDSVVARYLRAVELGRRGALRARAEAVDEVLLATVQNIIPAFVGPVRMNEHADQWATARLQVDSVRSGRFNSKKKFVGVWTAPDSASATASVLLPYDAVFGPGYGAARLPVQSRRLFFLDDVRRRPSLRNIGVQATAFAADAADIQPDSDAVYLGDALPGQTFEMDPPHVCGRPHP